MMPEHAATMQRCTQHGKLCKSQNGQPFENASRNTHALEPPQMHGRLSSAATLQELPRPSAASMPRARGNQSCYQGLDAPATIAEQLRKGIDVLVDQAQGNIKAYEGEATFTTFTRSRTHHHHRVSRSTSGTERSLAIHSGANVNHITCDRREIGLQCAAWPP